MEGSVEAIYRRAALHGMAAEWDGDDYATFEQKNSKRLILFARIRLADIVSATRFFTEYSGALERNIRTARISLALQFPVV